MHASMSRRVVLRATTAAALVLVSLAALPGTAATPARADVAFTPSTASIYTLVHGCYGLRSGTATLGAADAPYRMQATALGVYLLYGVHDDFLAQTASGIVPVATPTPRAEWKVSGTSGAYALTNQATHSIRPVTFVPANGCADYPEADIDASGATFTGAGPTAPVRGTIDAHTHTTAMELFGGDWHCGRPWHPYGVVYALPNCSPYRSGTNGAVEGFLDYGSTSAGQDPAGWPTFKQWPSPSMLAEEGEYWTGIERAWLAGLRVMVVDYVDNEALCTVMTKRHDLCNDMASVQIQWKDLHGLQDYIDAQAGGPGKGFFRIVTSPAEARAVANEGKLAVVQGIEVSDIFNCGEFLNRPKCTTAQIDSWLSKVWNMGVRSFFPIHKFDNAFGGTKMDAGTRGVVINAGNHLETGSFWNVKTCTGPEQDEAQLSAPVVGDVTQTLTGPLNNLLGGALLPIYPAAPSCNQRALTPLGTYLITQMIKRHFIVELDHMDARTADEVLGILESARYSGVISSHSWDSPEANPRIYALGGFVTPYAASAASWVQAWQADRTLPGYPGGIGFGSDMNGLGAQGLPDPDHTISYPFTSYDGGVTFQREQWGQRTFDLNTDGVANYGMYPDWLDEVQAIGGTAAMNDLFNGAEAYLQMWQRALS